MAWDASDMWVGDGKSAPHTGRMKRSVKLFLLYCLLPSQVFRLIFQTSPVLVVWRKVHVNSGI